LAILLVFELVVAVALGQIVTVHSGKLDSAWFRWYENPTATAQAAFERQKRVTEIGRIVFSSVLFAALAGGTLLFHRRRNGEPAAGGNAG
jgi:hypothetical protein